LISVRSTELLRLPLAGAVRQQAADRSITTNNQPTPPKRADIVAIAFSSFNLSQSEPGDAETKKREGAGSGAADEFSVDP
jgi:hypothetical protein